MAEMIFATPVSRRAYLGGRFAAGYIASVGVLIVVASGIYLGVLMPWVDPARLGDTSYVAYGYGFAVFVLPSVFFTAALLFLLATLTRSMLGTYVGVIAFFVLWQVAMTLIGNGIDHRTLGALIDPFGLGAFDVVTRYWSANDRNTRVPEVAGMLLANRAIWLAVGAALLAVTMAVFRLDREPLRLWRRRRSKAGGGTAGRDAAGIEEAVAAGRSSIDAGATSASARGRAIVPAVTLRSDATARGQRTRLCMRVRAA